MKQQITLATATMAKSNEKQKTMWDQCYTNTETNQFTCSVYKLTGFYMDVTLS